MVTLAGRSSSPVNPFSRASVKTPLCGSIAKISRSLALIDQVNSSPSGSVAANTSTSDAPCSELCGMIDGTQSAGKIICGGRFGSSRSSLTVKLSLNSPSLTCTIMVMLSGCSSGALLPSAMVTMPVAGSMLNTSKSIAEIDQVNSSSSGSVACKTEITVSPGEAVFGI